MNLRPGRDPLPGNSVDGFKAVVSWTLALNSAGVPAPRSGPQPLYQTMAAPIVVGSSLLSAALEGLGESECGGVRGANPRRPFGVPYPNRGLLKVADSPK